MSGKVQSDHEPISIELEVNNKLERFVTPKRISGTLLREATMIMEEIDSENSNIADLDTYMQFVCDVFGGQFNLKEFEEGVDARDLMKIVTASTFFVMGQVAIASQVLVEKVDIGELSENEKKS